MKMRARVYWALALVYLLHNDWWLWSVNRRFAGLPAGLAYHLSYCLVVVLCMALLVKYAWPRGLPVKPDEDSDDAEAAR